MPDLVLFHNKNCSSSRKALAWLKEHDVEFRVVEYLKHPLDAAGLGDVLGRLDGDPADLVRNDKRFKELGLEADDYRSSSQIVKLLVEHPELMQRPVVDDGTRAVIARPPEETLAAFLA
jgi:arsenate reductase (glutaredoxin)